MREPYEVLLGQYHDHILLWSYLQDDTPDFAGMVASEVWYQVSRGELLMLHVALAFYNGDRTATIADLAILDWENRARVAEALRLSIEAAR